MQRPLLITVALLAAPAFVAAAVLLVAAFVRLTSGARGLRARIQRLFSLPERTRPLPREHYYQSYWLGG